MLFHGSVGPWRTVVELSSNALKECSEMVFHTADSAHGNLSHNVHSCLCASLFVHTYTSGHREKWIHGHCHMDPYLHLTLLSSVLPFVLHLWVHWTVKSYCLKLLYMFKEKTGYQPLSLKPSLVFYWSKEYVPGVRGASAQESGVMPCHMPVGDLRPIRP